MDMPNIRFFVVGTPASSKCLDELVFASVLGTKLYRVGLVWFLADECSITGELLATCNQIPDSVKY